MDYILVGIGTLVLVNTIATISILEALRDILKELKKK